MKNIKINICLLSVFLFFTIYKSGSIENHEYIATTRWVAGITEIAGIENIRIFAPSNMVHPPEYELKPEDLLILSKAKVVFYAGYEKNMVEKINESLNSSKNKFKIILVKTENSLTVLREESLKIAKELNTLEKYKKNIIEIEKIYDEIINILKENNIYGKDAYVHIHQKPLAESLGFNIVGTFGPAPVGAKNLEEVSKLKPLIIIDNYHSEVAKPLIEVSKNSKIVSFLNFPGLFETKNIKDVLLYNKDVLEKAINKKTEVRK